MRHPLPRTRTHHTPGHQHQHALDHTARGTFSCMTVLVPTVTCKLYTVTFPQNLQQVRGFEIEVRGGLDLLPLHVTLICEALRNTCNRNIFNRQKANNKIQGNAVGGERRFGAFEQLNCATEPEKQDGFKTEKQLCNTLRSNTAPHRARDACACTRRGT